MKKLGFILVALVMVYQSTSAQGYGLGVKAGLNVSNVSNIIDTQNKPGFTGGIFVYIKVIPLVSISADVLYSNQGYKSNGLLFGGDGKLALHYINFPVLANFYVFRGLAVKTGLQPGFLMAARRTVTEANRSVTTSVKHLYHNADLSIPVGISYEMLLLIGLIFDARYNFGVTNIFKEGNTAHNNFFSLTAGLKF